MNFAPAFTDGCVIYPMQYVDLHAHSFAATLKRISG
jgi:hypothetical protein